MRRQKRSAAVTVLVLLGFLVSVPTGAADVIVDYDPKVDFSKLRTLGWVAGTTAEDPEVERRIRVAVERELVGAGLKEERGDPDILVTTHASIDSEALIDIHGYDYWQSFQGKRKETVTDETWSSATGTILVDILDPETENLIWRGVATGLVGKKPEKRDFKINQAIAKMFKGFPPKWKPEKPEGAEEN